METTTTMDTTDTTTTTGARQPLQRRDWAIGMAAPILAATWLIVVGVNGQPDGTILPGVLLLLAFTSAMWTAAMALKNERVELLASVGVTGAFVGLGTGAQWQPAVLLLTALIVVATWGVHQIRH